MCHLIDLLCFYLFVIHIHIHFTFSSFIDQRVCLSKIFSERSIIY